MENPVSSGIPHFMGTRVRRREDIPPDAFPYKTLSEATYDSGEYARGL